VVSSTYNLDANLTILRLYQIRPASINNKVVAHILLKALMQLPKPDFQLCVYQLAEKTQVGRRRAAALSDPTAAAAAARAWGPHRPGPAAGPAASPAERRLRPAPSRSARSPWRRS
jgi:hypothetical protein